ncbi:SPOR domain-containing protein [Mucilaginibacter litoreus]|uniref:SPOR domain-containing protein n=1 Tax=Mucilaginibacter litoreus TaxID=1048221 RepID=A0ABW3ANN2_9SPHI
MDVGKHISELLVLNTEVSVPGLGYFAHTRINGHYNQTEGTLYPPAYIVQFDPQLIEDEVLAEYVAEKKNISLASAKYFTEKYINNIKLLAQTQEAALADIGWFSAAGNKLYFKPNTAYNTHPGLFGYSPVQIQKIGATPLQDNVSANIAPAKDTKPVELNVMPQNNAIWAETTHEDEEYLINLTKKRKRGLTVTFIFLGLIFAALIVYLADRYDPTIFNLEAPKPEARDKGTVINAKVAPVEDTVANDTLKSAVQADSSSQKIAPLNADTIKTLPAVKDSVAGPRYEVMGGSFKDAKEANKAIANYKKLKIEARVVTDAPGKRVNLTLGTFKTHAEAEAARKALIATKKVKKDIYIKEIKPKL